MLIVASNQFVKQLSDTDAEGNWTKKRTIRQSIGKVEKKEQEKQLNSNSFNVKCEYWITSTLEFLFQSNSNLFL